MFFSREYNITFDSSPGPVTLHLKYVESSGQDLDDLLSNCMVSLETDHGGEGPDWSLGDLPDPLYRIIERDLTEALAGEAESRAEEAATDSPARLDLT